MFSLFELGLVKNTVNLFWDVLKLHIKNKLDKNDFFFLLLDSYNWILYKKKRTIKRIAVKGKIFSTWSQVLKNKMGYLFYVQHVLMVLIVIK